MGGYAFLKGISKKENEYILIMDRAFFPFGAKEPDFLIKRCLFLCWYLKKRKVDLIILACNTLSVVTLGEVRLRLNVPVIGVIELFDMKKYQNTLFIGTQNTVNYLKPLYPNIDFLATPELIEYIEHKDFRSIKAYINKKRNLFDSYSNILLGCTHFILIKHLIKNAIAQDDLFNIKMLKGIGNA